MGSLRKSENGYALVVVLLTITVIGIMAVSIMTNIMNSQLQFQKTEEQVQITKLTEMGKTYIENTVDTSTNTAKESTLSWLKSTPSPTPSNNEITSRYLTELNTAMETFVPGKQIIISVKENTYQYKLNVVIDSLEKKVKYTITPALNGVFNSSKSVSGEISINLEISIIP